LINGAIADSKAEKHADGAKKLYDAYLLDKRYNQFVLPYLCKC
jgi:hypothetical protein